MSQLRSLAAASRHAEQYDSASIFLHWAMALLIALNWLLGQTRPFFPAGGPRAAVLSTHMLIGMSIGVLLLVRIAWRAGPGRRLAAERGGLGLVGKAMHLALYAAIGVTVLAGLTRALAHGIRLYGTEVVPRVALVAHGPLALLAHLHGTLADLVGVLAALHALAALAHHFVLGDFVLLRMAPFLPAALRPARLRAGAHQPPRGG
ncbi:MAG TPA: cytochrome b/b6 domain-containing protein [Acetobacteraceae bacterium]|nr:cytochrome b/b6 domain-containing protein [Acetobacteraceae bacterium]